jgi:hypothetical protein
VAPEVRGHVARTRNPRIGAAIQHGDQIGLERRKPPADVWSRSGERR